MTEELEQLLKNLRKLPPTAECLRRAVTGGGKSSRPSYTEFVAGLLRAQWHERQESALRRRMAHSPSESARTLVAGDVPLVAPAGGRTASRCARSPNSTS